MSYYTSILLLSWLMLVVLCILVYENNRLSGKDKLILYLTYFMVILPSFAEWLGFHISGDTSLPGWVLKTVKCADFVLTPVAGGAIISQLKSKSIWQKLIWTVISVNAVFQVIAATNNWMIIVDEQNCFSNGPLYPVYTGIFVTLIILIGIEFIAYGKRFRRQNRVSLYAILGLVVVGVFMQEVFNGEIRTDYLALTFGMAAMYIHNIEFSQLASDDAINKQQVVIMTDALTGVSSRYAYEAALKRLEGLPSLPERFTVFSVDINGLKSVNDALGHEAGDELIRAAANCIKKVFGTTSICYRVGGDEFVILSEVGKEQAHRMLGQLMNETAAYRSRKVKKLQLAAACVTAADYPGYSCEKLIAEADKAMYEEKRAFYGATAN